MTIRWSDKEVLVVVGTGGMGLSTARLVLAPDAVIMSCLVPTN